MMLIKVTVAPSPISGNGIFADQFVPKGTVVWDFHEGYDRKFTEDEINALDPMMAKALKKYSYQENGIWVFCMDDARFTNHSDDPNTKNGEGEKCVAVRDIQIGEEITCNYYEFDDNAHAKLAIHREE